MKIKMKMPDLSTTEGDVKLLRWHVQPGQSVQRGQPLLEVETDKATMDVESFTDGVIVELLAQPEEKVAVGQAILVIDAQE